MTTKSSGSLRLFMAALVTLSVVVPGFLNRSAWIIPLATPAFTALYVLGKWNNWVLAWRRRGAKSTMLAVLTTLPIQFIVVSVFFLIGLGLSMLLGMSGGLQPLTLTDVILAIVLFLFAVAMTVVINRIEGSMPAVANTPSSQMHGDAPDYVVTEELELDIDPTPLTPQTFYVSRGYWKPDALWNALEGRGERVVKAPEAASEEAIAAAEARLGVRLPEGLRDLYKIMDGGYVGWLYVPRTADPGPFYDDWRGAFSIDYSSLVSLDKLGTVRDHYENFTDDPDEIPENADKMIVLQARYQDMTVLDYSGGPRPSVKLVDFDETADRSTDVEFADFDSFFAALRRPRKEVRISGDRILAFRTRPIGEMPDMQRASEFWGAGVHPFVNLAASRQDAFEPKKVADDDLVAETEKRLGVVLPEALVALWRSRNGGTLSACYLQVGEEGAAYDEIGLPDNLMPMEYFATLADVSDRIDYPEEERPLAARHAGADGLVILHARDKQALLLDYRGKTQEPGVLLVQDLEDKHLASAIRINSFDLLLQRLRAWKKAAP